MSTRGLYTFKGSNRSDCWNVYKHSDNYPTGAAEAIKLALEYAWTLPRYEADEFATAFIAANKSHGHRQELEILRELEIIGSTDYKPRQKLKADLENVRRWYRGGAVRLMPQGKPLAVAQKNCCDIEYRYEIYMVGESLHVKAFSIGGRFNTPLTEELIFCGELAGFAAWATREEEKETADA
jgi:hypothetical protein